MTACKPDMDMSGVDGALGDLVAAQIGLGKELLKIIGAGSSLLLDGAKGLGLPKGSSCCDIPEPCWMPKSLGEVCCTLVPGDTGEVCFEIVNEDFQAHEYQLLATGEEAGAVQIIDKAFTLGPKQRRCVSAWVRVPAKDGQQDRMESCCCCDDLDLVIWVRGCANHYLRWKICRDAKTSKKCCHKVQVVDRPDYELHWYDHFHIMRPCSGPAMKI